VAGGRWSVVSGRWSVVGGHWPVVSTASFSNAKRASSLISTRFKTG